MEAEVVTRKGEVQATIEYLGDVAFRHRKFLFWGVFGLCLLWLLVEVKEVTALLLLSYAIAILMEPLVERCERTGMSRSTAIIAFGILMLGGFVTVIGIAVPAAIQEYGRLMEVFPDFLQRAVTSGAEFLQQSFGIEIKTRPDQLLARIKEYGSMLGGEQLRNMGSALGATLLSGYSLTLTILNLTLLPFFVYYVACDLDAIHRFLTSFMAPQVKEQVQSIGNEILGHVYAFFRGQITVSLIMAFLYVIGLLAVGMPYALAVGVIAGLLNIVPYLGIGVGILFATLITLMSEPSWNHVLMVWGVFVGVQFIEGTFLTPKIVGESVGIHPLAAMLALIVGGQLFGLVGLIIAIPGAAAVRVLVRRMITKLDTLDELEPSLIQMPDDPRDSA